MKYLFALTIMFFSLTASAHEAAHKVENMTNWRGETTAWVFYCHIRKSTNPFNDLGHCVSTAAAKECLPPYAETYDDARTIADKACDAAEGKK